MEGTSDRVGRVLSSAVYSRVRGLWVSLSLPGVGWLTGWRTERSGLRTPRPLFSRYQGPWLRLRTSIARDENVSRR
jgi:hypothetical protein